MKKYLLLVFILSSAQVTFAETYDELLDGITEQMAMRESDGVIRSIDHAARMMVIGGHEYHVGPSYAENPLEVELYGTSAGSFELLSTGMKVTVGYFDFGHTRVALEIRELSAGADIEN